MAGYLDQYGAGDERREKTVKRAVGALVTAVAVGGILLFVFHNYRQERQVKQFFTMLSARDYTAAYALWGCTDAHPCRDYSLKEFMQDWGPQSVPPGKFEVLDGESCGSGVIVDVDLGKGADKKLWVERKNLEISFLPPTFPNGCPQRNRISDFIRSIKYRLHGRNYQ